MKIFVIACGTGGAEIFNALQEGLIEKYADIEFITISSYANNKLKNSKFINEYDIVAYIEKEKPAVIINERSNGLQIQNEITRKSKEMNIFNICLLDYYGEYDDRFKSCPDKIIVPSISTLNDLLEMSIPREKLLLGGNPAFDRLFECAKKKEVKSYSYNKRTSVLYTSQGLDLGFAVFDKFYCSIERKLGDFKIAVKTHPQESDEQWKFFLEKYDNVTLLDFDNRGDFLETCLTYDLIIGYNSTLQLQSYLAGVPTIFYEQGAMATALDKFIKNDFPIQTHPYGDFERDATSKVLKLLDELLVDEYKLFNNPEFLVAAGLSEPVTL